MGLRWDVILVQRKKPAALKEGVGVVCPWRSLSCCCASFPACGDPQDCAFAAICRMVSRCWDCVVLLLQRLVRTCLKQRHLPLSDDFGADMV